MWTSDDPEDSRRSVAVYIFFGPEFKRLRLYRKSAWRDGHRARPHPSRFRRSRASDTRPPPFVGGEVGGILRRGILQKDEVRS